MNVFKTTIALVSGSTANIAVTGAGFAPKAVIVDSVFLVTDNSQGVSERMSVGFASGTANRGCNSIGCSNARTTTTVAKSGMRNDAVLAEINPATAAFVGLLDIFSMDADGVTFAVDAAFAGNYIVNVTLLGGADFSAVVGSTTLPTATGAFSISGLAFQPNFVLFTHGVHDATTFNAIRASIELTYGFAASSTEQGAVHISMSDGSTDPVLRTRSTAARIMMRNSSVESMGVSFTSMDATGFTMNKIAGTGQGTYVYLAISAPAVKVTTDAFRTATGNFDSAFAGVDPVWTMFLAGPNNTADDGTASRAGSALFMLGNGYSSTKRSCIFWTERDMGVLSGSNMTNPLGSQRSDKILFNGSRSATDTLAIASHADVVSLGTAKATLNQDDADPAAVFMMGAALGAVSAASSNYGRYFAKHVLNYR